MTTLISSTPSAKLSVRYNRLLKLHIIINFKVNKVDRKAGFELTVTVERSKWPPLGSLDISDNTHFIHLYSQAPSLPYSEPHAAVRGMLYDIYNPSVHIYTPEFV